MDDYLAGCAFYIATPEVEHLTIAQLNETVNRVNALRPRPFITDDDINLTLQTGISPAVCAAIRENCRPRWIPLDFTSQPCCTQGKPRGVYEV